MSKGIIMAAAGAALIAGGAILTTVPGGAAIAPFLINAGAGLVLSGVGTMVSGSGSEIREGTLVSVRDPIAPWNIIYGKTRVKGVLVYMNSFGESDKYLDLIFVLAAHKCAALEAIYFDNLRVLFRTSTFPSYSLPINVPQPNSVTITDIARVNNVVTVLIHQDYTVLLPGDKFVVQGITGDLTLNGVWPVNTISLSGGFTTITYLSGGLPSHVTLQGTIRTFFPNYASKVYAEFLDGTQTLGTTFVGQTGFTLADGLPGDTHVFPNPPNPWNANCSLLGKTAVFLRLHYNDAIFANGLPQISFQVKGKNDILDPRTSTSGWTDNAALCIADFLANTTWGYKAAYSTEIPDTELNAAANLCDEAVPLNAGGTEKRYTCNGTFNLDLHRGDILRNLLTSCAGRLTYIGGKFVIWPAAWFGTVGTILANETWPHLSDSIASISGTSIYSLSAGGFRWKSKATYAELYNGVRGTYIAPNNNWQPSDFPWYAQDTYHGYSSDANLAMDGGDRRWLDIQLPFTISSSMAQRLAKIELLRRRQQGTGTFLLNMAGYQFTPMDVVEMDLPFFAWTAKPLEVMQSRLKFEKNDLGVFLMGVEIDVQETDSSVYFWSDGEELTSAGYQQALMPDTRNPQCPTNILLSSEFGSIFVTWTAPDDGFVLQGGHVELEYQKVESPEGLWFSLGKMDPTVTTATIPGPFTAGDQYNVRMRSVNAAGVPCDWDYGSPFDSSPPSPGPITIQNDVEPFGQWQPFQVHGDAADALYPGEWTFDLSFEYPFASSGAPLPHVVLAGKLPVSQFIPNCGPVEVVPGTIAQSDTGGSIPGGTTIYLQICATDALGRYSPPSRVAVIDVPAGTNTNQITISGILWPTSAGLTGYIVFASDQIDLICGQQTDSLSGPPYSPTTITINGPFARSTYAAPNGTINGVRTKARRLIHGGPVGGLVYAVTSSTVFAPATADLTLADNWAGRKLVLIGRFGSSVPFAAFNITAFDPATGTYTLDRDPTALGPDGFPWIQVGDVFVVSFLGYDNSGNTLNIADAGLSNATNPTPHTGEMPSDPNRIGNSVLVIQGKSRGRSSKIVDNGATDYTLDAPLEIDATSAWIVVIAAWDDFSEVPALNSDPSKSTRISMDTSNYNNLPILVTAVVEDSSRRESDPINSPVRMAFVTGAQGSRTVVGNDSQTPLDGTILFDTSALAYTADTLAADLTDTTGTAVQLTSGLATVNGTVIEFPASPGPGERMYILSGGGTPNLVVERGYQGTTATTHTTGDPVNIGAELVFNLLEIDAVPNLLLILSKISPDVNFVTYHAFSGDTLPGGGTYGILPDNTAGRGSTTLKAPGN